uniref:Matrix metalloproteinase-18-like n=1 Tax=Xiphophorus maculatus TaxID=8083 RepID=A0A3B5Q8F4_XIPMA
MTFLTLMKLHQSPAGASPLRIPAAPPQPPAGPSEADQKFEYLHHFYGYQPKPDRRKRAAASRDDSNQTGFCDKVKKMQRFFGLSPDGKLSEETLTVMKKPRCGLSDVEPHEGAVRWRKRTITSRTHKAIRRALKLWSSVSLIKFRRRAAKEADVGIAFVSGDHGDGFPFSGKGGALAHAFLPGLGIGGDNLAVHSCWHQLLTFLWVSEGISLPVVAAHEFGHALGLSHSPDPGSIMYPAYNFAPSLELSFDDVKRIQHLYGENPNFHLQSLKRPPPKTPDKCDPDLSFDAVTELQQEVVFFKDRCVFSKECLSDFADSCGENIPVLLKHASPSSAACGQTLYRLTWMLCMRTWRKTLFYFSKVRHDGMRTEALHEDRYTVFFTGRECWRSVTFSHFPSFSLIWLFVSCWDKFRRDLKFNL